MRGPSPFVGPNPYQLDDHGRFFGRDAEAIRLVDLILATPVVVLQAASGAGKTSLINAGVLPRLADERIDVWPVARVGGPPIAEPGTGADQAVLHALASWAGEDAPPPTVASLDGYLRSTPRRADEFGDPLPRLLVFDQFEELVTSYPHRREAREEFFQQLRAALRSDPSIRVVLAIRDDYLGAVAPLLAALGTTDRTQQRLEGLRQPAAVEAIAGAFASAGVRVSEEVAGFLAADLAAVTVEGEGGAVTVPGEFVEPVQLQVVGDTLWRALPEGTSEVTEAHVRKHADVGQSLQTFYESAIALAADQTRVAEERIRTWFDEHLVTSGGTRGQVYAGAEESGSLPNDAVEVLQHARVIRAERRTSGRWYELPHDRLIEPVRESNAAWRARMLAMERQESGALNPKAQEAVLVAVGGGVLGAVTGGVLGPVFAYAFGAIALLNGAFSGWRRIYAWRRAGGWYAFVLDSTWGLFGTSLGVLLHLANLFLSDQQYRPDCSFRHNRHVYFGGFAVRPGFVYSAGNVISNADSGRGMVRPRYLNGHETLHIWQSRIFGPLYQAVYVVWMSLAAVVAAVVWLFRRDQRLSSLVETAAYYNNPFEYWAYVNDGSWPHPAANPVIRWPFFETPPERRRDRLADLAERCEPPAPRRPHRRRA